MVVLLPRLPSLAAETRVRRFLDQGPENWPGFNAYQLPEAARFAATGGNRVSERQLAHLRDGLEALARNHGFDATSDRVALARFDAEAAAWIARAEIFDSGEALRDDVWNFVGVVLAPDIVYWRFGTALERYVGGMRNTYQRLWMRGRALDRGVDHPQRWQLLDELTEDAIVQITERPSIGGDPILARAVAEAWLRAAKHHGKAAMEPIMRRAVLRIRIRNEIRSLAELPPWELAQLLDHEFGTPVAKEGTNPTLPAGPKAEQTTLTDQNETDVRFLAGATGEITRSIKAAVERIHAEAERRGWLPPKS